MATLDLTEQVLKEDLEEYISRILSESIKKKINDPFKQQDFFRYLVSVASHPIGLRASVKPFNSKEEDMLNYLVAMFDINDFERLKKILMSYHDSDARRNQVDRQKLREILKSRRRHSWRPELRVRIKPPTFLDKESHYIDNLKVRVYIFKDQESSGPKEPEAMAKDGGNQRTVLNNIFKTNNIDTSQRIRPVSEMRCLVEFEKVIPYDKSLLEVGTNYKMIALKDGEKLRGDIRLKIRRHYCAPGSKYILRFEYWLNSEAVEANWVDQYRRVLKRFVYRAPSSCGGQAKSLYENEDQEFYGYINYKLEELPSHAIKINLPILTLQRRKINNCEIRVETRNRRLEIEDKESVTLHKTPRADTERTVSYQDFIINHMRLYANCFIYQSILLIQSKGDSLLESYIMDNVTIDSLFFNSAQTLINQHRLQSNLDKSEDKSLRRAALLIVINSLQSKFNGHEKEANLIMNLLISLARNEYIMAHKVIDDNTHQELSPFWDGKPSKISNIIEEMEITLLRRFAVRTLQDRIKKYFLPIRPKDELNRTVTLTALAMFKRALSHHERLGQIHTNVKNLRLDVNKLREYISETLLLMIDKYTSRRIEALIKRDRIHDDRLDEQNNLTNNRIKWPANDDWPILLRDLKGLNNDLYLYWTLKGIKSLEAREDRIATIIRNNERQNLERLIKLKIDDFLASP